MIGLPTISIIAEMPSLRYIMSTGAAIPDNILEAMPKVFEGVRIYLMYGNHEGIRSTCLPPEKFLQKRGSIGQAIPNVEVFVANPETGICGPGQEGELIHRSSMLAQGYWRNPEETARAFKPCPHLHHLIGNEKVFHIGNLVRIDEDGFLWFLGRNDHMIKCDAYRISPTEVEEILCTSKLVGEAVAFGVENEELGQVVHVGVAGMQDQPVDKAALSRYCRKHMPPI